jgi:hypothetical protein
VFTESSAAIIAKDDNLNILLYAAAAQWELLSSLPSWVSDWTSRTSSTWRNENTDGTIEGALKTLNFKQCGRLLQDGTILEVSGIGVEKLLVKLLKDAMPPLEGNFFSLFFGDTFDAYDKIARTSEAAERFDDIWILQGVGFSVVLRAHHGLEIVKVDSHGSRQLLEDIPLRYDFICDAEVVASVHQITEVVTNKYMENVLGNDTWVTYKIRIH